MKLSSASTNPTEDPNARTMQDDKGQSYKTASWARVTPLKAQNQDTVRALSFTYLGGVSKILPPISNKCQSPHSATLLPNGRLIFIGGNAVEVVSSSNGSTTSVSAADINQFRRGKLV
ncbi:6598_t:CDS:2 [Ambispora gerdemannii]|uniref:6598_t:CDS:1 n=1 Tax=Ambispora gerdemannii TaxID=144530 RepID=A0A9N9FQM6_9GLOM|nr:6598_t:CDS:2 [Ambispora gerdemannii]